MKPMSPISLVRLIWLISPARLMPTRLMRPKPLRPTRPTRPICHKVVDATEANEADEAFDAEANEFDEPTSGQNKVKANEDDVVIMPTKADEADAKAN